jgi:hypothetical protein
LLGLLLTPISMGSVTAVAASSASCAPRPRGSTLGRAARQDGKASGELVQQYLRVLKIGRVEALREPEVDRRKQVAAFGLLRSALRERSAMTLLS